jgi:hypothetical protein
MLPSCRRPFVVLVAFVSVVAALGTLGCATERKPINKVQANALAKTFFIGKPGDPSDDPEFYFRNFVVDASESQELIGIGSWGGVDRIKWEVSEKTLFARRSYGQNQGADNKGAGTGFPNGTIVAAYPIDSHFDIKRDYNPQTGEELNVVIENTTDRPWYERDYFRVDWSVNQVDTPQWTDMFIGKLTGDITVTPIAYYVSDPSRDDAPHFDSPGGYFDVTSKFLVEPAKSVYPWLPQCVLVGWVTGSNVQNCDGQEAVVRSSYLRIDKVDPNGDFEPFENTRAPEDIFGNPGGAGNSLVAGIETPARITYDPGYGYTDAGLKRLMHVHNIWKQSHQEYGTCGADADCPKVTGISGSVCLPDGKCTIPCSYDARRDGGGNGTDDQCENKRTHYKGSPGSQCSVRNRCTIPYRDRETKPIEWWVNPEMPGSLQDDVDGGGKFVKQGATEDVVFTWNQAIKLAVAHAREVECRRTGRHGPDERATCHAEYFDPDKTEMVSYGGWGIEQVKDKNDLAVTCHNPVRDYDPVECGARGLRARVGDIRHNFIFYWPFASQAPWGGLGNWNADPLTGQIIGASATVMGRSSTNSAAMIRDVLMVANGELTMSDITDGTPAALYQQRLQNGETHTALSTAEIAHRMSGVDMKHAAAEIGLNLTGTGADRLDQIRDLKAHSVPDPGVLAGAFAEIDGLAKPLLGTRYESQLISPSWLVDAAGLSPTTTVDDATLARVSPLRGRDPARMVSILGNTLSGLSSHGVCTFAASDGVGNPDIRGVAKWFSGLNQGIYGDDALKKAYPELGSNLVKLSDKRAQLIYDHLTKETYKGIALHEVGHALGMFHNFTSSYDAANYDPQYWQLRTNEGTAMDSCNATPRADGSADTCMGPRFLDPETDDEMGQGTESRPGIKYFGHTSTMEYQQERFFETIGLGQYDAMTMGALYGRVLETLDPDATDGIPADQQSDYESLNFTQLTEDDLVNWTPPNGVQGVQGMHYTELARRLKLYDASRCRAATKGELDHAEWRVVHGQICRPPPKDHATWNDFVDNFGPKSTVAPSAPSSAGNVRWPYRFGQDSNAYVQVNPFDSGADIYEVTKAEVERFTYSYPFRYFRRQRRDWNYDALPSLDAAQFFERLRSYHWVAARNNATAPSAARGKADEFLATDDLVRANVLAEHEMFQGIAQALLVPQIGQFGTAAASLTLGGTPALLDAQDNPSRSSASQLTLDASNARFVDPKYDSGAQGGGSWDYRYWITHAGFDVEKANAAMALTDGRPTLAIIERDTFLDGRHLYINFRTDMAKAVDRVMGGILANDWQAVATSVPKGGTEPQLLDFSGDAPVRSGKASDVSILFPNLGYRQQLGAMIWSQLFSREGTELTLANKLLMYVEGTEGVINIDTATGAGASGDAGVVGVTGGTSIKTKFRDPRSGFTYVARLYGPDIIDGKTIDSGIASRMIAHANDLLALAYQVEKDTDGKPIVNEFGGYDAVLDASRQPIAIGDATTLTAFADYVGLLDASVQISNLFGHGPL